MLLIALYVAPINIVSIQSLESSESSTGYNDTSMSGLQYDAIFPVVRWLTHVKRARKDASYIITCNITNNLPHNKPDKRVSAVVISVAVEVNCQC